MIKKRLYQNKYSLICPFDSNSSSRYSSFKNGSKYNTHICESYVLITFLT